MNDLRAHFRPEFLNRLDETILFKPLTKNNIGSIIDLLVADINKRLADKELVVALSDSAKQLSWTTVMIRYTVQDRLRDICRRMWRLWQPA